RQRLERKLAFVALAQQYAKRPITFAPPCRWRRKTPRQQRECPRQFMPWLLANRLFDHVALDTSTEKRPRDPIRAPLLQRTLVLGKHSRVARVVEITLLGEHSDR